MSQMLSHLLEHSLEHRVETSFQTVFRHPPLIHKEKSVHKLIRSIAD